MERLRKVKFFPIQPAVKKERVLSSDFPSMLQILIQYYQAGYRWLSACVAKDSAAINQMIEIMAQAVTASFKTTRTIRII
jgi:hypothetical protein